MARKSKPKYTQNQEDLRFILNQRQGRRVLWRLFESAGVHSSGLGGTTEDLLINAGARSLGLEFLNDILQIAPERYVQMLQEQNPGVNFETPDEDDNNVD